jgi:hypothetical protein
MRVNIHEIDIMISDPDAIELLAEQGVRPYDPQALQILDVLGYRPGGAESLALTTNSLLCSTLHTSKRLACWRY